MFAVVNSIVEYWILSQKGFYIKMNRNAEVKRFEIALVTPSARDQIQLDEVFLDFLLNCVHYSQRE